MMMMMMMMDWGYSSRKRDLCNDVLQIISCIAYCSSHACPVDIDEIQHSTDVGPYLFFFVVFELFLVFFECSHA